MPSRVPNHGRSLVLDVEPLCRGWLDDMIPRLCQRPKFDGRRRQSLPTIHDRLLHGVRTQPRIFVIRNGA